MAAERTPVTQALAQAIVAADHSPAITRICREYLDLARELLMPRTTLWPRDHYRVLVRRIELMDSQIQTYVRLGDARDVSAEVRAQLGGILSVLTTIGLAGGSDTYALMARVANNIRFVCKLHRVSLPPEMSLLHPMGVAARAVGMPVPPLSKAAAASMPEPQRALALRLASFDAKAGTLLMSTRVLQRHVTGIEHLPPGFVDHIFDRVEKLLEMPEGSAEQLRTQFTDPSQSGTLTVAVNNLWRLVTAGMPQPPRIQDADRRRIAEVIGVWIVLAMLDLRV